jgi:hypothetical protein
MTTEHVQADEDVKPTVTEPVANGSGSPAVEGMPSLMSWQPRPEKFELEQESKYYHSHLPEWGEHEGEHILIHGQEHFGFFETRNEALTEGLRRFGRVPFFVKQVQLDEKPRPMMWVML